VGRLCIELKLSKEEAERLIRQINLDINFDSITNRLKRELAKPAPEDLRWRRAQDYHYYENIKGGWASVIGPRDYGKGNKYAASTYDKSKPFKRLCDAKHWVEVEIDKIQRKK
jgi:hypothetical protein